MIESIAKYHHVHKPNFLTGNANNLNARISLGETWLIAETKRSLVAAGINIDKLERIAESIGHRKIKEFDFSKSTTTILVRNLPYGVTLDDLTEVFGKLGTIARIVLPETATLAIIEYNEPKNAKAAFNSLAFQYFMEVPLYLEWAPKDIFACSKENTSHMGSTTLNINARLPLIPNTYNKKLEFDQEVLGNKQKSRNQLQEINGKKSEKQYLCSSNDNISRNKGKENEFRAERTKTNKIKLIVKNVAFEATREDVMRLFMSFSSIKACRLPKKPDGNHKGFAFLDLSNPQDSQVIIDTMSNTHFYGRHLIIERVH